MPIKPENRALYPANWIEISRLIRQQRAGGHCERCGVMNRSTVARWKQNPARYEYVLSGGYDTTGGEFSKPLKIILTVAHLDHDPTNNDPKNLAALCQRCHNRHDVEHRKATRAMTKGRKTNA